MVNEVFNWGLRPGWVTADSWYSSVENLKFLRNKEVGLMMGLEKDRLISTVPHCYEQVGAAPIPSEGLYTHLKGFDFVKVFQTVDTEGHERYYALYGNQAHPINSIDRALFKKLKQQHWHVEQAFRAIKQLVHAGHFFVRRTTAIQTHLFCVLRALQRLMLWAKDEVIRSIYQLHDQLFLQAQRQFIQNFA
jgi:Transposase DDE domain